MTDDRWGVVERAFTALCAAYNGGRFTPLLEADVAGYVYHAILTERGGDATCVHLDTRLLGPSDNDKYDLVIGECVSTDERKRAVAENAGDVLTESMKKLLMSKSMMTGFRPAIRADLIIEFKAFVYGFDHGQLSVHLKQALTDVEKLLALTSVYPEGRAVVLFDNSGHLTSSRLDQIVARRGTEDTRYGSTSSSRTPSGR
jgi:hypothetical protein